LATIFSDLFQKPQLKLDAEISDSNVVKINKKLTRITRHNTVSKRDSNRDSFFVPGYLFQSIERSGGLTNCNPIV